MYVSTIYVDELDQKLCLILKTDLLILNKMLQFGRTARGRVVRASQ